jgi:hypothetical protein
VVGYEVCGIKGTRDAVTELLNTGCIRMEEDRGIVMEAEGWIALTYIAMCLVSGTDN